MSNVSLHTLKLNDWLTRIRANDPQAREDLMQALVKRVEQLARQMLRGYPAVRAGADTLDIAQGSLLRILRAFESPSFQVDSTRQFMSFTATCIRNELLDLVRRYAGAKRGGGRTISLARDSLSDGSWEPAEQVHDPHELELWERFHEAVEQLPSEEREVVGLKFYHGWSENMIADLFQVSDRTVRRWWVSACVRLNQSVGGSLAQD